MVLIILCIMASGLVLWTIAPLIRDHPDSTSSLVSGFDEEAGRLARRTQRIADLSADRELGKVDEQEFSKLREED